MPVAILFAVFFISVFAFLVGLMVYFDSINSSVKLLFFSTPILVASSVWLLCFVSCDWKVKHRLVLTFDEMKTKNCAYQLLPIDTPEVSTFVNLNKRFGMAFEEGYMFEVVVHERGPYCGLFMTNYDKDIKRLGFAMQE